MWLVVTVLALASTKPVTPVPVYVYATPARRGVVDEEYKPRAKAATYLAFGDRSVVPSGRRARAVGGSMGRREPGPIDAATAVPG
jgi:hypothetical protein